MLTFSYQEQQGVDPSPSAPDRPVFRPKIPLRIAGPRGDDYLAIALVDTGADETILPLSTAKTLKVQLGSKLHFLRDPSDRWVEVRYGTVILTLAQRELGEYTWESKVAFQARRRYTILGRAGCLDHLGVCFDGPNRRVIITTP